MKKHLTKLNAFLVVAALAVSSCNNAGNSAQSTTDSTANVSATTSTAAPAAGSTVNDANGRNADSNFVIKAALTNAAELRILQAGIDKGTDKELKAHAKMMMTDHKKLGDKVQDYATKKGYTLPSGDNGKADDELSKLNSKAQGTDFDKEWVSHMVSAHQDAIDMFEKRQNETQDQELKDILSGALPTLHNHLDMMKQLDAKLSK